MTNKTEFLTLVIMALVIITYWSLGFEPTVVILLMVIAWYLLEINDKLGEKNEST